MAYLWDSAVIFPIKILTVFFHETSHAIAAVLTGGEVHEMVVNAMQGGHVISSGGSRFWGPTSGYLGSLGWGALIYLSASLTRYDREIMGLLGLIILVVTITFMSPFKSLFGFSFSIVTGCLMLVFAKKLPAQVNDFSLRLTGLACMYYVPMDIYSDTIARSHLKSDAYNLAQYLGGSTQMWGYIWLFISVVVVIACIGIGLKYDAGQGSPDELVSDEPAS